MKQNTGEQPIAWRMRQRSCDFVLEEGGAGTNGESGMHASSSSSSRDTGKESLWQSIAAWDEATYARMEALSLVRPTPCVGPPAGPRREAGLESGGAGTWSPAGPPPAEPPWSTNGHPIPSNPSPPFCSRSMWAARIRFDGPRPSQDSIWGTFEGTLKEQGLLCKIAAAIWPRTVPSRRYSI